MPTKRNLLILLAQLALLLPFAAGPAFSGNPAIGLAVSSGSFEVNHSRVAGSATLFDGATVETTNSNSDIQLQTGARVRLSPWTRAEVFAARLVLQAGLSALDSAPGFVVEAGPLHVSPGEAGAAGRIRLTDGSKVTVAALRGTLQVSNTSGLLLARVAAGTSLDFHPEDGPGAATRVTGCLLEKAGSIMIAEQLTGMVMQLDGAGLRQELGNRVEIVGTAESAGTPGANTAPRIRVAAIRRIEQGGCGSAAKKIGAAAGGAAAGGAAAAAAASGIAWGTVAIIGGVAAAATVGGLAATGSLPGEGDSPPAVSR